MVPARRRSTRRSIDTERGSAKLAFVPTIRSRIQARDRDLFVGRDTELDWFESVLSGETPQRVVFLHGPGGVGKSALIREVERRAEARGLSRVTIDGREVAPFPAAVEAALQPVVEGDAAVVVFDSYELITSLDSHLRDRVIPELPDAALVIFASRQPPSRGWFERGWDDIVKVIEIAPLRPSEARQLLERRGLDDSARIHDLVVRCEGSPLALVVASEAGPTGSIDELVDRLLGGEVSTDRYRTLSVAALARVTTPELLNEVGGDDDPHESYKWLADRSFAEPLADGITLHELVSTSLREQLRQRDPQGEGALRRTIADVLYRRALAGRPGVSTDLQHLIVDQTVRWGYSTGIGYRYRIDTVRPGDTEYVRELLQSVGFEEWWTLTERFFVDHPEHVGIARDRAGRVGGYFVAVTPANAPEIAEHDVMLGSWLRHARTELRTTSVVLWREAVDLTGQFDQVTALLGAGGLITSGIGNPRYVYLPISPAIPQARAFAERLGAVHLEQLDLRSHGQELECHLVDFGPGGLIGNQRDWIYRETGAAPPGIPSTRSSRASCCGGCGNRERSPPARVGWASRRWNGWHRSGNACRQHSTYSGPATTTCWRDRSSSTPSCRITPRTRRSPDDSTCRGRRTSGASKPPRSGSAPSCWPSLEPAADALRDRRLVQTVALIWD